MNLDNKPMEQKQAQTGPNFRALTTKMALSVIVVAFTPIILVSGILLYQFRTAYHEKVSAHLETLVRKHKQSIDGFLDARQRDIRVLARTFGFDKLRDEVFLQERLTILQQEYGGVFVDLGVINARGLQVAYAGPFKLAEAQYSDADWFQQAMQQQHFVSDVFLGLRGQPHFIIASRDTWKGQPWILRATIDFVAFNTLVENIRVGETGLAFVLNRKGEFQTRPRLEIDAEKEPYMEFLRSTVQPTDGVTTSERRDSYGRKKLYVRTFLKNGEWLLVYQQDASDAFADLDRAVTVTLFVLVLSGVSIVTVAYALSRRMAGRLSEADKEKQMIHRQIVETGKLASVGELAAGIAHEINNPVAIMVEEAGWIEDLLEEEEFRESKQLEEFKRAVNQIRNQGRRCKAITHKLLSFARKTDSRVQPVQVNDLIEELVSLSAQRAKYSNVKIETKMQPGLPSIPASQTELQQVFLNLINNALDAMEKTGGALQISSRKEGEYVVIDVADDGPGIPQANLSRVFDPFFTTKPVGKGTGLGLSICYGIIKKMGGDIEVDSVVHERTCFTVRLPLKATGERTSRS